MLKPGAGAAVSFPRRRPPRHVRRRPRRLAGPGRQASTVWPDACHDVRGSTPTPWTGSFSAVSADVAVDLAMGTHLHRGPADGGGLRFKKLVEDKAQGDMAGDFVLTKKHVPPQLHAHRVAAGVQAYCDVHSEAFRAGELRGQLESVVYASTSHCLSASCSFALSLAAYKYNTGLVLHLTCVCTVSRRHENGGGRRASGSSPRPI